MKEHLWIAFVVMTVICWGCYVPTLHEGQKALGGGKPSLGGLRAFICVGVAYLVVAVIIPVVLLFQGMEAKEFSGRGTTFGFFGGALGALGALGIILAMKFGGTPVTVPPLVFAGAPIVSTLVAMMWHPPKSSAGPIFYVGLVMAAVGAALVLYGKPSDIPPKSAPTAAVAPATGPTPQ